MRPPWARHSRMCLLITRFSAWTPSKPSPPGIPVTASTVRSHRGYVDRKLEIQARHSLRLSPTARRIRAFAAMAPEACRSVLLLEHSTKI